MNNNLPRVYANPIDKELSNNLNYHICSTSIPDTRSLESENIPRKINEIFASPNHVYKSRVRIKLLNNEEIETTIVGKTGNYLLNLNGDKVSINNIINIDKM